MFHPTTFGKYFLTRRIAVGGMAEVFAAKLYGADGFEKDLVIKQILPQYAKDPEFVQSFVAEAKIAVTLTHANIVSIYELGRVEGTYFIAMEFVDGLDVFALLDAARRQDDPLEPGLALLIVEEVSRGLEYAHRKLGPDGIPLGLVHRDLNPRNVLVSREGDVKILDFGIAKTASKSAAAMPKTRAGVVKGTTGYMSPEQATGQPIDLRTDIYQGGLLLHECLTGRALFWRPEDHLTRELMRRHEVIPPSRLVRALPPEVDEIVLTSLRIRPEERFQTAAELTSAIARVRAIRYPQASHLSLGAWVSRVIDADRAAARAVEDEIPATADFSEVISKAIERSISPRVETIATRAPSGVFAMPRRPTTGSQPLDPRAITGDLVPLGPTPAPVVPTSVRAGSPITGEHPQSAARSPSRTGRARPRSGVGALVREHAFLDPDLVSMGHETLKEGTPRPLLRSELDALAPPRAGRRWAWAAAGALIAGALVAAPWVASPSRTEPALAASTAEPDVEPAPTGLTPPPLEEPPPERAPTGPPPPSAEAPSRAAALPRKERPAPREAAASTPARADFGSRPCGSRVTLDGSRLASATPIFDHAIAPGRHSVVMVAEGCPLGDKAGVLEQRPISIDAEFEAKPGARLKIKADFDKRVIKIEPRTRSD